MSSRTKDSERKGHPNTHSASTGGDAPSASPSSQLSDQELQELREIFDLARSDKQNDYLTLTDLRNLMNDLRLKPTEDELEAIFEDARAGADSAVPGAGSDSPPPTMRAITFDQFANLMARRVQSDFTPSQLRNAFQLFESGDNGFVSTEVLVHALCTYGSETMSRAEAQRLVDMVDPHHTGKIDYIEFISTVTGENEAKLL